MLLYFEENAKDFIQFKASLLMQEAKNDPIKKADLIRDMVISISKIPDRIKREVYIKECSRIMDISEDVLFNTLAQLVKKDLSEANKQYKNSEASEQKAFEVVKNDNNSKLLTNIEVAEILERDIISILLNHGDKEISFVEEFVVANDEGFEVITTEVRVLKVFEKLYLDLQEDEIEFSNEMFRNLVNQILSIYLQKGVFDKKEFTDELDFEYAKIVIDIQMNNEKYSLDGWLEKKQVFVKSKDDETVIKELITQTMIAYREYLIQNLIKDLMSEFVLIEDKSKRDEIMININDYNFLKSKICNSIGRLRTDFFK